MSLWLQTKKSRCDVRSSLWRIDSLKVIYVRNNIIPTMFSRVNVWDASHTGHRPISSTLLVKCDVNLSERSEIIWRQFTENYLRSPTLLRRAWWQHKVMEERSYLHSPPSSDLLHSQHIHEADNHSAQDKPENMKWETCLHDQSYLNPAHVSTLRTWCSRFGMSPTWRCRYRKIRKLPTT